MTSFRFACPVNKVYLRRIASDRLAIGSALRHANIRPEPLRVADVMRSRKAKKIFLLRPAIFVVAISRSHVIAPLGGGAQRSKAKGG